MNPRRRVTPSRYRGISLLEATFGMVFLAGAFVAILAVLNLMANGMFSDTVYSDQTTRTSGTLYDIVAEVRDASAYSPNFYIEVNDAIPPSIVFDKIDSVDSDGNVVWGSKITYRLEKTTDPASAQFQADHANITPGRIVRQEDFAQKDQPPAIFVVEEHVPYQFIQNGNKTWGFNVTRNGCALSVTVSRFGDLQRAASIPTNGDTSGSAVTTIAGSPTTLGSIAISTATGVYYLKNPKVVIPAE